MNVEAEIQVIEISLASNTQGVFSRVGLSVKGGL